MSSPDRQCDACADSSLEPTGPAPMGRPPELLLIVRRGATERFRLLTEMFAEDPVCVLWDRRGGDRRRHAQPVGVERRQGERRTQPPWLGGTVDWMIIRAPGRQ
jgi:hypothetical protein